MRETPISTDGLARLPVPVPPFLPRDFTARRTARGFMIEMPLDPREQIFGLGLQMKSHNQRGLKKVARVNSDPVADTGDAHAPVPFFVSTRGYGVLVDTARYAVFEFGVSRRIRETAGAPRAQNTLIEIPAASGADIYLFAGPTMREAVQRYNLFSGSGVLPPLWGLGVWYRTSMAADEPVVRAQVSYFRDNHVPCDVFGFEPTWQTHSYSCTFVWDTVRFPDPAGLTADINAAGYRINLWEHAFTHPDAPFYAEMKPLAGDHEVWDGLVPDFALPPARALFGDHHARLIADGGISGFKLDECDNSDLTARPWSFPEQARFPSGLDGEQMHSMFGVLYQRTMAALFRRANVRTLGQVRSSHALAAPLPFVLYSDLYDHRDYLRALVNSGFSGLLWSPEVRQAACVEDLLRRVQSVIFSPHALVNAFQVKNPPWMQFDLEKNNRDEFLPDWRAAESEVRRWFEMRMSFLPYLYSAMARYRLDGIPPVRAMVMDWPDEEPTWACDDQWMFGDGVLVAPVIWPARRRDVYLPRGGRADGRPTGWYDFWTGERHDGGATIGVDAPPERIPLFVREDSLLPLALPVQHVARDTVFQITVHVFGSAPAPFTLWEDDGVTYDFESGAYSLLHLAWAGGAPVVSRSPEGFRSERYRIVGWRKQAEKGE